jgi:TrmH family RNA methyltransferase
MPMLLAQTILQIVALKQSGVKIFAAVAGAATSFTTSDFAQPCALLIGNEGAGLSPKLLALADEKLTIPTPGAVESLNAAIAGSLLLHEASRQRGLL